MVQDLYFSFDIPEIFIGLAVLTILGFGGVKLAKLSWAALFD